MSITPLIISAYSIESNNSIMWSIGTTFLTMLPIITNLKLKLNTYIMADVMLVLWITNASLLMTISMSLLGFMMVIWFNIIVAFGWLTILIILLRNTDEFIKHINLHLLHPFRDYVSNTLDN
jgi:hypothetical protein